MCNVSGNINNDYTNAVMSNSLSKLIIKSNVPYYLGAIVTDS